MEFQMQRSHNVCDIKMDLILTKHIYIFYFSLNLSISFADSLNHEGYFCKSYSNKPLDPIYETETFMAYAFFLE